MNPSPGKKFLQLSIIVILMIWVWSIASNIFIYDVAYFKTLTFEKIAVTALLNGTIMVLLVWVLTYLSKEQFSNLGFFNKDILKQILRGLLFGLAIFILSKIIIDPLLNLLIPGNGK